MKMLHRFRPKLQCIVTGCIVVLATLFAPPSARASDIRVRGILDLAVDNGGDGAELNHLWGDNVLDAYRVRVFGEAAVADHLDIFTEALFDEEVGVRAVGAYALFHPSPGRDVNVMAGLIPWPIGTFAPRSTSDKNPLIGFPLMYQYHTTLESDEIVQSTDELLAKAGTGEGGYGMPIIYDQWWDFGIVALGSSRPYEYSLGFVNGSPGYPSAAVDETPGKSYMGRFGLAPTPGLRFGVSGSYGAYLEEADVEAALPPGSDAGFHQLLRMADVEWSAGHAEVRSEGFWNTWETPIVGDLHVRGGYVEAKYALPAGFYLAGRFDVMRFSDVTDSTGTARSWDADVDRMEVGAGYRIMRGVIAKAVYQRNRLQSPDPAKGVQIMDVVAGQLSVSF